MSGFIEIAVSLVLVFALYFLITWLVENVFIILPAWLIGFITLGIAIKLVLFVIHRKD